MSDSIFLRCIAVLMLAILSLGVAVQIKLAAPAVVASDQTGDQRVTEPSLPQPSPEQASSVPELTGATWEWHRTELGDDTVTIAQDPSRYTVTFLPEGQVSIRADCNQAVGAYVRLGASLSVQLGPVTLAACEPGSLDTVFLQHLGDVASYELYGQDLVLNQRSDTGIMIFTRQRPVPLAGTSWQLQAYYNVTSFQSPLLETEITATFGADGIMTGSAGCNRYRGPYTVDNGTISIGPLTTTRQVCPEPIMEQERGYLAALELAARYAIAGGLLTLHAADDTRMADFVAATAEPSAMLGDPPEPPVEASST